MKIKQWSKLFLPLFAILAFVGCDDNTANIGLGVLPDTDGVTVHSRTYNATSETILADSVYSRTRKAYLGKFTDPDFGYYECDFLTQFNCVDDFTFNYYDRIVPQNDVKRVSKIELTLTYQNHFGDPDNTSRLSVFELNDRLENEKEHSRYTDFNVEDYYDASKGAIARKSYIVNNPDYASETYSEVVIPLSNELGDKFLELYKEDKNNFLNTQNFLENVFKGVYVKSDIGDGTILYIDYIDITLYADIYAVDSVGKFPIKREQEGYEKEDSIIYNAFIGVFNSTYEIFQTNRIQNSDLLKARKKETGHTYVKSPAGLFTEITLPYDQMHSDLINDSINAVKLTLSSYAQKKNGMFTMSAPSNFLLLRKGKMYSFFENNEVIDGIESFIATRNASTGKYSYANLLYLVSHCIAEKEEAKKEAGDSWNEEKWVKDTGWDKVVIIPVSIETDNNTGAYTKIEHNLSPEYARLEGGPDNPLEITVTYTRFHDQKN